MKSYYYYIKEQLYEDLMQKMRLGILNTTLKVPNLFTECKVFLKTE